MLAKFSLYDESEAEQWDDFVKSHRNGTPFHLTCWLRTLQDSYSFRHLLYCHKTDTGNISGILPCFLKHSFPFGSKIISIPFSDYGGALFRDEDEERDALENLVMGNMGKARCLEIRGALPQESDFLRHNHYKRHVIRLSSDPLQVKSRTDKRTTQYSIRKAERAGVKIREQNNHSMNDRTFLLFANKKF